MVPQCEVPCKGSSTVLGVRTQTYKADDDNEKCHKGHNTTNYPDDNCVHVGEAGTRSRRGSQPVYFVFCITGLSGHIIKGNDVVCGGGSSFGGGKERRVCGGGCGTTLTS